MGLVQPSAVVSALDPRSISDVSHVDRVCWFSTGTQLFLRPTPVCPSPNQQPRAANSPLSLLAPYSPVTLLLKTQPTI